MTGAIIGPAGTDSQAGLGILGGAPEHRFSCSKSRCGDAAAWAIVWRNPKIHAADRRKTWLACDAHRDELRDFLAARDFPLEVITTSELEERDTI